MVNRYCFFGQRNIDNESELYRFNGSLSGRVNAIDLRDIAFLAFACKRRHFVIAAGHRDHGANVRHAVTPRVLFTTNDGV